ncbi:MAG: carbohydrate-binding protein [Candidatus Wallbacteria bacterium]|nr:carbohydrate-binding protein [Candidatus Wallbacteria bacterium]
MIKLLVTLLLFTSLLLSASDRHVIYCSPNAKVYVDQLQWQRIDSEVRDYLKNLIVNGGEPLATSSRDALSAIRYQPYSLVLDGETISIILQSGTVYQLGPAEQLSLLINRLISTSCIRVTRLGPGIEIRWNVVAENENSFTVTLKYSAVSQGSWAEPKEMEMSHEFYAQKGILSVSYLIPQEETNEGNMEFVLHIKTKSYDYWDNNEGQNYSIGK